MAPPGRVSLALLYPYLNKPTIWMFVTGLVLIHLLQDLLKYSFTQKTPSNTFIYFIADQFCHIGVISAIFLFPVNREILGFPSHPFLDAIYRTNIWTIGLIFSKILRSSSFLV